MEFFRKTNINFLGKRRLAYLFSGSWILIGIISLILHGGPRLSIDFTGGLAMRFKFEKHITESQVRTALSKVGLGSSEVKIIREIGAEPEILVKTKVEHSGLATQNTIIKALQDNIPANPFDVRSVENVGARIGGELALSALWAVLATMGILLIYIAWRFEFFFGLGAVIALFHDVIITVGILSLLNREISLVVVAALLTLVGFSLNDTIVVFDRIRENIRKHSALALEPLINLSINETLSRTIITSGTVFLVVVALFFFGGQVLRDFSLALIIGVIFGTYSSIYIASPILLEWGKSEVLRKRVSRKKK